MYRILDVKKARNHRTIRLTKSVMSSKATLLAVLVLLMFLPLAFSTQGLSSHTDAAVEPEPVLSPTTALPDNRIIYAENHQVPLTLEDHYSHIPFFTESESMNSTLTLNNNMPDFMKATVTVFNQKGDSVVVPPIALQPMNAARFSLKEFIKDAKGDFSSGSIEIFYHGSSMAVTSQISIISSTKGLAFESTETSAMNFASNRLDAIAWLPDSDTQAKVAITNTTDNPVNVTVTASQGQSKTSKSLRLEAREMQLFDLKEVMESPSDTASSAILSVEHSGMHGAVIATGFVLNEQKGFSGNILFVDRAMAKTSRLAGAHVKFGMPRSKEGFPQGTRFSAPLLVANLSDAKTSAQVYVDYTIASVARRMDLGEMSLEPGALKQLELAKEMARRGVLLPVDDAGVDIEYTGKAGTVIGRLTSVDQTGEFVYDVPVKDPLGEMMRGSGCHPWRLDNGYTTVVHLKNTFNKKVYALVQIRYEGGSYNLERLPLAPFQSITIDIGELRNQQEKDIRDSVMPIGVESGQVAWYEEEVGSLIGRAEIAHVQAGIASSFSCGDTCICPPSFSSTYVTPSGAVGAAPGSTIMAVYEMRSNCTTTFGPYNRTSDSNWTSTNSGVATVSSGSVTHVGTGSCSINAQFTALVYLPGCATMNVYPNPGSGLSVLQVAVKEVGFKNDHQLSRYVSGTEGIVVDSPDGTEPTWKSVSNPDHPVAYTKGALPALFATFGVTPSAPSWATAKIRVKNGSTVIGQTPTISFTGAQFTVSPINVTQALETTVKKTTPIFTWEISYNGGTTWTSLGLSGPHTMYWTYATPLSPPFTSFANANPGQDFYPLYDLALEKACGYSMGNSSIGNILSLINAGVKNDVYYDPSQSLAPFTHPLEVYTQFYHCHCAHMAAIFRGLIRSIGINGQTNYYFGGLSSNQIRTFVWGSTGDSSVSLRMTANAEDFAGVDPHFAYHSLVSANGTLYDPTYGVTRSSIPYTETAWMNTPLQSTTAFPSQPNSFSGYTCSH